MGRNNEAVAGREHCRGVRLAMVLRKTTKNISLETTP